MAHIGGDGVQVGVSRAELGYHWESPAGSLRGMFVEKVPSTSDLHVVELKHKLDVLHCPVVASFPIGGVNAWLVKVL